MEWLINNWSLLVVLIAAAGVAVFYCRKFLSKPTDEQIKSLKEWVLFAVIQAEKEFGGGGTGKVKLRYVYDAFVTKFAWAAKVITFEELSVWVDEALIEMRHLLETNTAIKNYVG